MFRIPSAWRRLLLYGLPSLLAALALTGLVACGSAPPSATPAPQATGFGPLSVLDRQDGLDARGGMGPIHIADNCVTMTRENGDMLLLVWHAADVSWDEKDREITFTGVPRTDANPLTLRDGDIITVGGEPVVGDVPVERHLAWLATPRQGCSGEVWIVDSLTKP